MYEEVQTAEISSYSEVIEMPLDAAHQRGVLLLDRLVPMALAPGVDGLLGPSQAPHTGLACRLPSTIPDRSTPIVRESQEIEGARPRTSTGCLCSSGSECQSFPTVVAPRDAVLAWMRNNDVAEPAYWKRNAAPIVGQLGSNDLTVVGAGIAAMRTWVDDDPSFYVDSMMNNPDLSHFGYDEDSTPRRVCQS